MARKAKPSSRTSIRFIAADDSAIGLTGDELNTAYTEYMQTMDERVLKLQDGEVPSYYHLRVLPLDLQSKIRDALTTDDEKPLDVFLSPVGHGLLTEFINRCLLAVDAHPYVAHINEDGTFKEAVITWTPGDPRPANLTDILASEEMLAINMFWFVFRASQLTDEEKKH